MGRYPGVRDFTTRVFVANTWSFQRPVRRDFTGGKPFLTFYGEGGVVLRHVAIDLLSAEQIALVLERHGFPRIPPQS
ncbi:hypothetical protein CCYA_CCYA03G0819 [Cyanidiococcus yangmingshanensis]|nr:hypothetical protein CCYA_CCYA03G0819 [Cyanidiococcus yangmingshanensis]